MAASKIFTIIGVASDVTGMLSETFRITTDMARNDSITRVTFTEFWWKRESQNRESSNNKARNDDIEEEKARNATNSDVEGDIRIRFRAAAEIRKKEEKMRRKADGERS